MSSSSTSTYSQYKHGTEAMLKWLSKSLNERGITFHGRLEDASIRSLLSLASQAQRKGAPMPTEVLHAVEDTLKIRRQYHAWYSSQICQTPLHKDNKHVAQSNETHAAFIEVLQGIHDLFAPTKPPANQPKSSSSTDKKILEISNIFTNLKTEDVTTDESQVTTAEPSHRVEAPSKPCMARKSQMLFEDKILELYCLYNNASNIRGYLRQKWADYASQKLDIISAAMITQEALELFSEAEKSFEDKYGRTPRDNPGYCHPKYLDIIYYLAIGEPLTSTYTSDELASMPASDIEIATREAQLQTADRQMRIRELDWKPSEDLDQWLMRPAACVLDRVYAEVVKQGDGAWALEQAFRTPADRADALNALGFDEREDKVPEHAAQELLNTFVEVYAGMVFMQQNQDCFIAPTDIITSQWLGGYDCSVRMVLSIQILHDIRTARSDSWKLDILTQVSKDYERMGVGMGTFNLTWDEEKHTPISNHPTWEKAVAREKSWLEGRVPGKIVKPRNVGEAKSRRLSELPLATNPVLVGMLLFDLFFKNYKRNIEYTNEKWFLIPCAHWLNWLAVRAKGTTADLLDLFPDMHTTIGLVGPRLVWLGSSPPGNLKACRNRILLAWGLQLTDFYHRIINGGPPKAEELFRKIRNNTNANYEIADEQCKSLLDGNVQSSSLLNKLKRNNPSHPLKIETSQSTPLLDAIRENLRSSQFMRAQQKHIRKIILGSESKCTTIQDLDILAYLDAFCQTARAEMPRLIFPYNDVSVQCGMLSIPLFLPTMEHFDLSSEILESDGFKELKGRKPTDWGEKLGSGAQCVTSFLALATIFGDRFDSYPVELSTLQFIEDKWDKPPYARVRRPFTEDFVEKCKEFGFAVPECATAALA